MSCAVHGPNGVALLRSETAELTTLRAQLTAERERADRSKDLLDELARVLLGKHPTDRFTYEPDALVPAACDAKLDAERLDWLAANVENVYAFRNVKDERVYVTYCSHEIGDIRNTNFRAAIDAAREKGEQKG